MTSTMLSWKRGSHGNWFLHCSVQSLNYCIIWSPLDRVDMMTHMDMVTVTVTSCD